MIRQVYAKEEIIPISEFADAMRESDAIFAERVAAFAERFGCVSHDMLGVLAQSAYICWFECEFEEDLVATCRAIGSCRPTSLYICGQISPQRWLFLNEYVLGIQTWLGMDAALEVETNNAHIQQIVSWLGQMNEERKALATLFLSHLIQLLSKGVSLSRIGSSGVVPERTYTDFSKWYSCPSVPEAVERTRKILGTGKDELISGMNLPDEPACQYRWPRYLDIKVCSIGAMRWRGNLPEDSAPKQPKQRFWSKVDAAFRTWQAKNEPKGTIASIIHEALGEYSEIKSAVLGQFLNEPPPGTDFCSWTIEKSRTAGLTPAARFDY